MNSLINIERLKERSAWAGGCVDISILNKPANRLEQLRLSQANQHCLMMTLAKKIAATASITRPIRLLPARICSGVRRSCGLRVMLDFLNTFRDWRIATAAWRLPGSTRR
jgi:hypothetical protein